MPKREVYPRREVAKPTAHLRWRGGVLEQKWEIYSLIMTPASAPDAWVMDEDEREEWRPIPGSAE